MCQKHNDLVSVVRGLKRINTQRWCMVWIFHLPSCTGRKTRFSSFFSAALLSLEYRLGLTLCLRHPSWIVCSHCRHDSMLPHRCILLLSSWLALSTEAGWQRLSHWCSLTLAGCAVVTLSTTGKKRLLISWCHGAICVSKQMEEICSLLTYCWKFNLKKEKVSSAYRWVVEKLWSLVIESSHEDTKKLLQYWPILCVHHNDNN